MKKIIAAFKKCWKNSTVFVLQELEEKRETMFFRDGKRRIDFVLAYHESEKYEREQRRKLFEENLKKEGLELEYEDKKVGNWRVSGMEEYIGFVMTWRILYIITYYTGKTEFICYLIY